MARRTSDSLLSAWTTDANGMRVRVGLTVFETDAYQSLLAAAQLGRLRDTESFRILHEKHEMARRQQMCAPAIRSDRAGRTEIRGELGLSE